MAKLTRLLALLCLAAGTAGGGAVHSAFASSPQTITVGTCDESHLDAAVATANTDNAGDTITFTCSGTITLTSTLTISGNMTIDGSGQNVVLDGGHTSTTSGVQIMTVNSGVTLALTDLTLSSGEALDGGAIYNDGTLTITDSTLSNNIGHMFGAAIDSDTGSTLTITDSTFSNNSNDRGYVLGTIYIAGDATITGSTFSDDGYSAILIDGTASTISISSSTFSGNYAVLEGGGAISSISSGLLTVSNSTFFGNQTIGDGGAIYAQYGTLAISNSTFDDNSAGLYGGAIANDDTATILSSTFSGNIAPRAAPGAIANYAPMAIGGSILADTTTTNCNADPYPYTTPITDLGYNLEWSGSGNPNTCISPSVTTDITADPDLKDLANNGGPTETMALPAGSPAIDRIPTGVANNLCPASGTDQRGYPRPDQNEAFCDIGAYEYQNSEAQTPNGQNAYDIESSNWSCPAGGTGCVPTGTVASQCVTLTPCPEVTYGDVEAFGPPNNSTYGIPDELVLACVHGTNTGYQIGYLDVVSSQGAADYPAGTRSYPGVYGNADLGVISGKGTLIGGGGGEDNSSQPSSVSASVYDSLTGIIGSVTGIQNTNNQEGTDTLNSGGFRVTIRGRLWTVSLATGTSVTTRDTTSSTLSCTVGGSYASDLMDAGMDTNSLAEGELEPTLGDNFFLQGTAPPRP